MSGSGDTRPDDEVPSRFHVDVSGRTLLGIYKVEKRLAEGGMGSVWLAEDTNLGRRVVVKVPHARFLGEPGFRSRFRREITELVRLEHPHVVRILARGEEDQVPFFVLQYLGGGSLEDRMRGGKEPPEAASRWLDPIAKTLDFLHARGVVHRDVKPGNILFDEEGHVFLSDFGVVKALGREDGGERTEVGTGVGSPIYMSPEQGLGREVTGAADQYALASALYEALAGEPPFGRGSVVEVMLKKQGQEPPPLREKLPSLPAVSEAAVGRALSKDPAQRFPTCAAFADEFRRGFAPAAGPGGPPRRHLSVEIGIPASVLVVALIVVGVWTHGFGLFRGSEAPPPVAARPFTNDIVVVGTAGAAPRRVLLRRWKVGDEQRFVFHSQERIASNDEGVETLIRNSGRDQQVALKVASVAPDGSWRLDVQVEPAKAIKYEGDSPGRIEKDQKAFDGTGALTGHAVVHANGGTTEAVLAATGKDVDADLVVSPLQEGLRSLQVVFPDEPIGVGAIWDVTQAARIIGMRFQQTTTYTLVEADGDRVKLKFRNTTGAPPQDFHPPGTPESFRLKVKSWDSTSEGETIVDLSRPSPVSYSYAGNVDFVSELPVRDPAMPQPTMHIVGAEAVKIVGP